MARITEEQIKKIRNILIDEGQRNSLKYGFSLGETIKFNPTQVEEILTRRINELANEVGIMTDEEYKKKKEEIVKHNRDVITNGIYNAFNRGFDMGKEYAKDHQKVVYQTKYVYTNDVEVEPTDDRYTSCYKCKYAGMSLNVCQAMLCKHSIKKLNERFEPKEDSDE